MPNKTIYVSDDDLPLLSRAQELTGGTLSATIVAGLRRLVEMEEGKRAGLEEISVKVGSGKGRKVLRFLGTRLGEFSGNTGFGSETYAVFRTSKNRYAVHHAKTEQYTPTGPNAERTKKWSTGWRGWIGDWSADQAWLRAPALGTFTVVDTPEELHGLLPDELYEMVMSSISHNALIEDLDI